MEETAPPSAFSSVDDFARLLSGHFELDPGTVRPDSRVTADLGLDSIGVFELVMIVEDLGVDLTDEQLERLVTVQDWYDAYRAGCNPR